MRPRSILGVLVVAAFLGLLTYGLASEGSSGPQIGEPVPDAPLETLGGEEGATGSLADYRGRWVLVNFWASWCEPCRAESPELEALQQRYGGPRFTVLGIDTRDLTRDGLAFVREFGLTYPQLRDGDGEAAQDWGTTGVPENFLVDPDGVLRELVRGPVDARVLRQEFVPHFAADLRRDRT